MKYAIITVTPALIEQFDRGYARGEPDECWLWPGSTVEGYGKLFTGNQTLLAHRVSYAVAYGDPGDILVCHTCDVRNCVNPSHLFLGDHSANGLDSAMKERHGQIRISREQIPVLIHRFAGGESKASLARAYSVSPSAIGKILSGQNRGYIR